MDFEKELNNLRRALTGTENSIADALGEILDMALIRCDRW